MAGIMEHKPVRLGRTRGEEVISSDLFFWKNSAFLEKFRFFFLRFFSIGENQLKYISNPIISLSVGFQISGFPALFDIAPNHYPYSLFAPH
jgi:hypothetical protein